MAQRLLILLVLFASAAFAQDTNVHTKDLPIDFPREYRMHIGINGIILEVDAHWDDIWHERYFLAVLTQPDGADVVFDIKHPADKILDRDIVPIVVTACRKILEMDRKYLADGPKAATDRAGHKWVRQ